MTMVRREEELGTREALTLRVAELSTVCKQQRDEIEEQRSVLEMSRKQLRNHEEIIRIMEAQLIERDAQLASATAEIRALKRQHNMDAETIRHVHKELHPKKRGGSPTTRAPRTPQSPLFVHEGSSAHIKEEIEPPLRKQLQQAIADKVILVRALHQLTAEMAQARAEVRKHAAASERSLSTAWRLGQLGQLGLQLLEEERGLGDETLGDERDAADGLDALSMDEGSESGISSSVISSSVGGLPLPAHLKGRLLERFADQHISEALQHVPHHPKPHSASSSQTSQSEPPPHLPPPPPRWTSPPKGGMRGGLSQYMPEDSSSSVSSVRSSVVSSARG